MTTMFDAGAIRGRMPLRLRAAALDSLFTGLKPMVLGFVPTASILLAIAWETRDRFLLVAASALVLVIAWRLFECRRYRAVRSCIEAPSAACVRAWEWRYGVPTVLYSLCTGVAAARITALGDPYLSALAMIVAVANLTGAVSRNAGVSGIVIGQVVATLGPISMLLATGGALQVTLMLLLLPSVLCFHWLAERQRNMLVNAADAREQVEAALARSEADAARLRAALTDKDEALEARAAALEAQAEALEAQASAEEMSRLDRLTGLYDATQLDAALREAVRAGGAALVLFDLDGFKGVNRAHGRRAGDRLLRECARRLRGAADERSTVDGERVIVRMGGDRFASVIAGTDAADRAALEIDRVMRALRQPFDVAGTPLRLRCSAGMAVSGGKGADRQGGKGGANGLLGRAETALEDAKRAGRGSWRLFDPVVGERVARTRRIEADLPHAVERGEMALHFQPLVDLEVGRVTTCEALLRWTHTELGAISPGEFVPVAEHSGAIDALGAFVLAEACRAAAGWPGAVRVAVNLSPRQFRDRDLAAQVADTLARTGLAPARLELELTESAVVDDFDHTRTVMAQLRDLGVRMALDDFGTGQSSLSILSALPFDKIKLDRSFVTSAQAEPRGMVLVRGITRVAREMGLAVVVEGVETQAQLDRLVIESRPDEVQGYLFSRPLPERDARTLLQRMPAAMTATLDRVGMLAQAA